MSEWIDISTAPKDGATILLYCPQGDGNPGSTFRVTCGDWVEDYGDGETEGFVGWMSWDGGFSEDTMMPTHWQPLPSPPTPSKARQTEAAGT